MPPSNESSKSPAADGKGDGFDHIELGDVGTSQLEFAAVEKRLVRKLDLHVVPLVTALYLLSFLDRSNVGNAKIAGMEEDLNLYGDRYDWLLTIFYIPYIVFELQAMMWKVVPPHIWAAIVVFIWGLVASAQAGVQSWGGEMALRFLLGAAEAGYGPGIPYLLSFFYLRHEIGLRTGIFLSAAPLANTFAGALAYGITSGKNLAIANWRLLFLVEGLPTVVMAAVAFFFLPDSPSTARFLTEEEKRIATARGVRQVGTAESRIGSFSVKEFSMTLIDPKAWLTAFMYFSCNVSFASLPVFLPTILEEMGFEAVHAQGLTAPPFFVSFVITITTTFIADRTQQRGLMIIALSLIAGTGYVVLATVESTGPRYFAVFLAAAGVFPAIANILPWVANNQGSDTRRGAAFVLLNWIGQCGPLLGTRVFPEEEGPYYVKGQSICAAFMFFNALLALTLRTLLWWENRRLARKDREMEAASTEGSKEVSEGMGTRDEGVENYGRGFRYVL